MHKKVLLELPMVIGLRVNRSLCKITKLGDDNYVAECVMSCTCAASGDTPERSFERLKVKHDQWVTYQRKRTIGEGFTGSLSYRSRPARSSGGLGFTLRTSWAPPISPAITGITPETQDGGLDFTP